MLKITKSVSFFLCSVIIAVLLESVALYIVAVYERSYQTDPDTWQRFIHVTFRELMVYAAIYMVPTAIAFYLVMPFLRFMLEWPRRTSSLLTGGITALIIMLLIKFTTFGYPIFQLAELVEVICVFLGGIIIAFFRNKALATTKPV
ncbi:MAG: hypothetical protein J0I41_08595 [Filimonas sp.]|nr:hypothetical protein [Filimonas sp.]